MRKKQTIHQDNSEINQADIILPKENNKKRHFEFALGLGYSLNGRWSNLFRFQIKKYCLPSLKGN